MCDAIRHRGPDDWGTFVEGGIGLGMRRLSIIDLAGGHQPMAQRGRQRRRSCSTARSTTTRPAPRAGLGPRPPVPDAQRHRGPGPPLRGRGRADARAAARHVRLRASGTAAAAGCCWRAITSARSRCSTPMQDGRLAFASEIKALLAHDPSLAHAVAVRARPVPDAPVRAAARHLLRAHPRAAARSFHGLGDRRGAADRALLGPQPSGRSGRSSEAETLERDRRAAGRVGRRCISPATCRSAPS